MGFERRICLQFPDMQCMPLHRTTSIQIELCTDAVFVFRSFQEREQVSLLSARGPLVYMEQAWLDTTSAFSRTKPLSAQYTLGLCFIVAQCLIWIGASVLTQFIGELHFHSPFLMTYIGVSLLALMLPCKTITDSIGLTKKLPEEDDDDEGSHTQAIYLAFFDAAQLAKRPSSWSNRKHFIAALYLSPAMFLADWWQNASLTLTSVASSTVLVSTSCVFVVILATCILRIESYHTAKLAGAAFTVIGTALTTYHDTEDSSEGDEESSKVIGDLLSLAAALAYAVYSVQMRMYLPQNEELYSTQLLLGYVGLVCSVVLLPFALYSLYFLPADDLTWVVLLLLLVKGLLDFVVTDYIMLRSIVLTNATVASVGLGLTIPFAFLADHAREAEGVWSFYSMVGALAVAVGFVIVNLADNAGSDPLAEKLCTDELCGVENANLGVKDTSDDSSVAVNETETRKETP